MPKDKAPRKAANDDEETDFQKLNRVQTRARNLLTYNSEKRELEVVPYPADERGDPLSPEEAAQFFLTTSPYQAVELKCMCNQPARCFQITRNSESVFAGHYVACCVHKKGSKDTCPFFRSIDSIYNKGPVTTSFYGRIPGCRDPTPSTSSSRTGGLPTPSSSPVKAERKVAKTQSRCIRPKREPSEEVEIVGIKKAGVCFVCHKPEIAGKRHVCDLTRM
ncbi:hypothetical protein VNI00_016269 [Paramarasmius palmivorus]|uniref:Uncharacterized protein n=1 Tax=Paramarasmius palmivorus TaxID=297713 RepID=A0AAW0BEB0_9AGAR